VLSGAAPALAAQAPAFNLMRLLVTISTVLTVLLILLVLTLLTSGAYLARRSASDLTWLGAVHAALLVEDGQNPLRGASRRRHALALTSLVQHVTGDQRDQLREWAKAVGLDNWARRGSWAPRATRRVAAVSTMSTLGIDDDRRLRACSDRNPRVRMCAAEPDFTQASQERIDRLIGLTTDASPRVRFAARDSLARLGGDVAPSLLPFLASADRRVAAAALDVAQTTPHPVLLPAALALSQPDRSVEERLQALRLLSRLECPERVPVLREALGDDDPHVRAAGADGLRRAKAVSCASALSERLRDPAWEVRRAAGGALRELGPVGLVLLRSAVRCDDRFAVDMARTMLNLPPAPPVPAPLPTVEPGPDLVSNGWQVAS